LLWRARESFLLREDRQGLLAAVPFFWKAAIFGFGSNCGGALHALQLFCGVRRRSLTSQLINSMYKFFNPIISSGKLVIDLQHGSLNASYRQN
jgi:hypothetical protein